MSLDDTTVSFSLEINLEPALTSVRKFQTVAYRSLGLIRRMSGDEKLDAFIMKCQRAITVMNELRLAYASFMALRMAAGDPLAWAQAAVATAGVVVSVANEMDLRAEEY